MRYDAPQAVRIGDNSLNLAQAHLNSGPCCLHTSSCTKCVAQLAELGNTIQLHIGLNHNLIWSIPGIILSVWLIHDIILNIRMLHTSFILDLSVFNTMLFFIII